MRTPKRKIKPVKEPTIKVCLDLPISVEAKLKKMAISNRRSRASQAAQIIDDATKKIEL